MPTGNRVGTIAAEQSIRPPSPSGAATRADQFQFPGEIVPVSLELAFEDIRATPDPDRIDITGPNARHLVTAVVTPSDLTQARAHWRRVTASAAEMTAAVFVLLLCGPLLDWRDARESRYVVAVGAVALAIIASRILFDLASPADWSDAEIFSAAAYASPLLPPFLASPFDFLVTAGCAGGIIALLFFALEAWRLRSRHVRRAVDSPASTAGFFAAQLAAGIGALAIALAHYTLLADTVANTTLDLLHFSLHPWNAALTALQIGIVIWDATALAAIVLLFRAAYLPWRIARGRWSVRLGVIACWTLPCVMIVVLPGAAVAYRPVIFALALAVVIGIFATRVKGRYRQGSQAFRLTLLTIGLVLPALAFYPDVFDLAHRAKTELVETRYGPQALNQRQTIQSLMQQSLEQIDMFPAIRSRST